MAWLCPKNTQSQDTKVASRGTSTGKRKRGQPKNTWRRTVIKELPGLDKVEWRSWLRPYVPVGMKRMSECIWVRPREDDLFMLVRLTLGLCSANVHRRSSRLVYGRGKRLNFAPVGQNSGLFLINPNWVLSSDYEKYFIYLGPKVTQSYFKVSFTRMWVFWRQKKLKDVAYLPSLCPAPEKAWTLGLGGGTYSSCLWSSIFTWTSPLRDKANNSCGISLKSDARPFRTVLNAEPQEPKTLYHPGHLRSNREFKQRRRRRQRERQKNIRFR